MKWTQTLLMAFVGLMTVVAAQAQDFWSDHIEFNPTAATFNDNEFSLDLFGFRGSLDKDGRDGGAWGPGVGLNYYITHCFGIGADSYADAFNDPYILNVNALARYPLDGVGLPGLAPYGFFGIGRQWIHAAQWMGDVGAGLEYRFAPKTGAFTDLRGVFPGVTRNYVVWRFGIRIVF